MSDKVGRGVSGPVPLHKSLASGESYAEAVKCTGAKAPAPKSNGKAK
jgi:hypothetical protein